MHRQSIKSVLNYSIICTMFTFQYAYATNQTIPKTVITCTSNQCPIIPSILNPQEKLIDQAIVYQTSNYPEFMTRSVKQFSAKHNGGWQYIVINPSQYANTQPVIGFGGAFTDTASMLYQNMSANLQKELIDAYFSSEGLAYSLGRVPIASNDFSCRNEPQTPSMTACSNIHSLYSYADKPDTTLSNFTLQTEDLEHKIPMIQAALRTVQNNELKLFASPWSAPAWMKTNGHMVHGNLNPAFQPLWANYFVKFLEAYQKHDITFWGLTVQNEPEESGFLNMKGMQTWQTMYSTKEEEASFVKNYLGPALKKFEADYGKKVHLMIHDDQITKIHHRVSIMDDPEVAKYVDGAALHWYMNIDPFYSNLDTAYDILNKDTTNPNRFILGTEACEGYLPTATGPSLGSWSRGEAYGHDIISDINHHVSGWTDWNLLLDMKGGASWAKNYLDAPILVDLENQTFYKQPMYYYLGHFSKFVRPGSRLLASKSNGPFALEEVSFEVPAHQGLPTTIVVVVLNRDITGRNYYIQDDSNKDELRYLNMSIPAHAIQTIIYKAKA